MENKKKDYKHAAIFTGVGAAAGGTVAATVGTAGLAVAGTAVSIGAAPIVAAGAALGLAAYGVKKLFWS
jgi:hypothetical protein